jgi:uncharacterized protein (TIGR03083 family)
MQADMDNDDTAASLLSRSDHRLAQLARHLDHHQWAAPSLCSEWTNHEVLAHLVVGYSTPIGSIAQRMLRRRGNFDATNTALARELAATRCPAALLDDFDQLHRHPRGIGRLFPSSLMLGDHVIHELDIMFALGRPSTIPVETLTAVLNTEVRIPNPFVPARRRSQGLHLQATDTPWEHRSDPTSRLLVRGAATDLASVLAGRPHALPRLTGIGVNTLRARITNADKWTRPDRHNRTPAHEQPGLKKPTGEPA